MRNRLAWALLAGAGVAGCAVGPDYERPELELPETHRADLTEAPASAALPEWRDVFEDEILQALIEQGLENNLDLAAARSRMTSRRAAAARAVGSEKRARERADDIDRAKEHVRLLSAELHVYGPFAIEVEHALRARRQGRMKTKSVTLSLAALKEI